MTLAPTPSPVDDSPRDDDDSFLFFGEFDWWVWVLIFSGGIVFIVMCCLIGNNAIERERQEKARGVSKPPPTESALENPIKALGNVVEGTAKVAVGVTSTVASAVGLTASVTGGSEKSPYGDSSDTNPYAPPSHNDYVPPDDLGTFDMSTNTPTPDYSVDSSEIPMTNTSAILKPVGENEVYESGSDFDEEEEEESYEDEEGVEYEYGEEYEEGEEVSIMSLRT